MNEEREGNGIQKWLAITILIIIVLIIIGIILLIPFWISPVKSVIKTNEDFVVDFQINNPVAVLNLPARLTEFKSQREVVRINLLESPFVSDKGEIMIAIRDLENIFPAKVQWFSSDKRIRVFIPRGIISQKDINLFFPKGSYIIKNNRAFVSLKQLLVLLQASEINFIEETMGIRVIWNAP